MIKRVLAGLFTVAAISTPAYATSFTFSGTIGSPALPISGTADFTSGGPGVLQIVLTSTIGGGNPWLGHIAQTLVGIDFTFSGVGGVITGLTNVSPSGAVSCFGVADGVTCGNVSVPASPANWKWGTNSNTLVTGLYADQLHPDGIVNAQIQAADGVQMNSNHNPLLLSTTFLLSYTGTINGITDANMYFGTDGDHIGGTSSCPGCSINPTLASAPEPTAVMLLGTGLLGMGFVLRRRLGR